MGELLRVIGYGRRREIGEIGSMVKHMIELNRKQINEENKDELEVGTIVRIKNRKLGRRKLENIWGEANWEVEGRGTFKGSSAYTIKFGQARTVENMIHLRVIKDQCLVIFRI